MAGLAAVAKVEDVAAEQKENEVSFLIVFLRALCVGMQI